ncbi:MAG: aminotransferase class V-fold PLP-dependent enzyme [Chloroflexota bacterium]|nr:aminotransferase class V-fold PLP-dependent enzyme [Chloroflexota bacterium]MDE2950016.1 aminotransferase class V-fold PLP-dependent enzyme [Chloroflexota bacterium]
MSELLTRLQNESKDKAIYRQALDHALAYLDSLKDRPAFPTAHALEALQSLDEGLPAGPCETGVILQQLHEIGAPAAVAQGGGRYFGFVNGGVIPAALAARLLADVWDQNAALGIMSPIAAKLEAICETWLVDLLDLPKGSAAGFVSGTSTASLCGLLAGRNAILSRQGWDVAERGLFGAPPIRLIMSEAAHGSVYKALTILGIGQAQIELAATDDQGRFDTRQLPQLDKTALLILQAGNVNSGAFDDFATICAAAKRAEAWVHVDGAFGLWARACRATARLSAGIELADSWSVDAHKTLNSPYDCGIVFCKDRLTLLEALQASGSYLHFSEARDGMLYTPEMSRRARGIELWALLKALGRAGVDELVAQLCARARQFADELARRKFRVLNDVVFNQVLVACESAELTRETLRALQASGECWCGGSEWRGEPVIRISVCSWATTEADVRRSVTAFAAARSGALSLI